MTTVTYPVITEEGLSTLPNEATAERKILSSNVLSEEVLSEKREPCYKYVEVPVIEEVIKTVTKKSVVEIEKIVPKVQVEYVEKIVEIPQIHYIDRQVEKEHIQEVIHEVPGELEIREIPRVVIEANPQIQNVKMEKVVEVPGSVIDVTKSLVEIEPMKQYHDVEVPVVVAQTIRPMITQYDGYVDVDVVEYEPEIMPVDVYIATPIASKLVTVGAEQDVHNCVSIPPAQYNSILKSLNQHIPDDQVDQIPFIKTNGKVGFLETDEAPGYFPLETLSCSKEGPTPRMSESPYDTGHMPQMQHQTDQIYYDRQYSTKHSVDLNSFPQGSPHQLDRDSMFATKKAAPIVEKKKKLCGC